MQNTAAIRAAVCKLFSINLGGLHNPSPWPGEGQNIPPWIHLSMEYGPYGLTYALPYLSHDMDVVLNPSFELDIAFTINFRYLEF